MGVGRLLTWSAGAAAGAGAMWLLDPESGPARRRVAGRRLVARGRSTAAATGRRLREQGRDLAGTAAQGFREAASADPRSGLSRPRSR